MQRNTVIQSISRYVPERVVTNAELTQLMDTSDAWIRERSGISERRFVEPGTRTSDLAVQAGERALSSAAVDKSAIDLVIAATLSPDYYFPGIGSLIQHKLGLALIPALDIRAQCSGFVYGLCTADAYIRSGQAERILLVCAEVQSPALDLSTAGREMAVLFGDGAAAVVLEGVQGAAAPLAGNTEQGVIDSLLGSDGSGAEALLLREPGTATKGFLRAEAYAQGSWHPQMDGRLVFRTAVERMVQTAREILDRNGVSPEDLTMLFPHQANARITAALQKSLELPVEKVCSNIDRYGNTTSASIPIGLSEAVEQGAVRRGDLILTLAFGAGFTWGANLIRW